MTGQYVEDIFEDFHRYLDDNESELDRIFLDIQYSGFNAEQCRKNVIAVMKSEGVSKMDLISAISMYLVRGTNEAKISNKTTDEGKAVLARIKRSIGIVFKKASELKPNDVTLPRLAASFPDLVGLIIAKRPDIVNKFDSILDEYFLFPQGASLIPVGSEDTYNNWKLWAFQFHKLINPQDRNLTAPTAEMVRFWNISWRSNLISDAMRVKNIETMQKSLMNSKGYGSDSDSDTNTTVPSTSGTSPSTSQQTQPPATQPRPNLTTPMNLIIPTCTLDNSNPGPSSPRTYVTNDSRAPNTLDNIQSGFKNCLLQLITTDNTQCESLKKSYIYTPRVLNRLIIASNCIGMSYITNGLLLVDGAGNILKIGDKVVFLASMGGVVSKMPMSDSYSKLPIHVPYQTTDGAWKLRKYNRSPSGIFSS